jgi:hypothetical protein
MKITCANCGKSFEYAIARNFEGRVECLGCEVLLWVVAVGGELEEIRIDGGVELAKPRDTTIAGHDVKDTTIAEHEIRDTAIAGHDIRDITIAEHDIEKSWKEWKVDSFINLEEFERLVKRTYLQLVERAKKGKAIFYSELEVFDELKSTFGDGVARVIGFVVGACSEAELQNSRPPISAIVVEKDTGNPGHGFYGLTVVPEHINYDAWEGKGVHEEVIPIDIQAKRLEFWEQKIKEVHAFWGDKE